VRVQVSHPSLLHPCLGLFGSRVSLAQAQGYDWWHIDLFEAALGTAVVIA
jgi:hypothetical protein